MTPLGEMCQSLPSSQEDFEKVHDCPALMVAPFSRKGSKAGIIELQQTVAGQGNRMPLGLSDTKPIERLGYETSRRKARFSLTADKIVWIRKPGDNSSSDEITLGRAGDNDLVFPNSLISKHHLVFKCDEGIWKVADQNSTNGTALNGQTVFPTVFHTIRDWDRLDLAKQLSLQFFSPIELFHVCLRLKEAGDLFT